MNYFRYAPLALGVALLGACQNVQPISPSASLGKVELPLAQLETQLSAFRSESGLSFTPQSAASVCDDAQNGVRIIARTFTAQNTTGNTLTNLQLHAYSKIGNSSATALKNITSFGGNTSQATAAVPRHGVTCAAGVIPLQPQADKADLQVYTNLEISLRTQRAGTANLALQERLLAYGYLVRQTAAQSLADTDSRTIANNESAQVTIALKVPYNASNSAYNFSMTFLLFTDTRRELVQLPEDVFYDTTAGVSGALPDGAARVSVLGGAACGLSGSNRFQNSIAIANNNTTITFDPELNAPTFATVASSTDLQAAINNATAGSALCFEGERELTSSLVINKNLSLLAGEGAGLVGFGMMNITAGQVNLYGIAIESGNDEASCSGNACGGGIKNQGTLRLFASRVTNNQAVPLDLGQSAYGGGIYNSGNLTLEYTRVEDNLVNGLDGAFAFNSNFGGGSGGEALGAGIFNVQTSTPNTINIKNSLISNNSATGGNGGDGGDSDDSFDPFDNFCDLPAGSGGDGGAASGGGVYRSNAIVIGAAMVLNNAVSAGAGGAGGLGDGNVCDDGMAGDAGVATFPNVGP
jgi:hypothetical protein